MSAHVLESDLSLRHRYFRLGYEAQLMDAWAERQRAKGRPEAELTFDNFVRDTGYLWRDELRAQ